MNKLNKDVIQKNVPDKCHWINWAENKIIKYKIPLCLEWIGIGSVLLSLSIQPARSSLTIEGKKKTIIIISSLLHLYSRSQFNGKIKNLGFKRRKWFTKKNKFWAFLSNLHQTTLCAVYSIHFIIFWNLNFCSNVMGASRSLQWLVYLSDVV